MSRLDETRLMAKVARMYYDQGIRQQEITERLNIHQSKVSRMLKRAREANIVRISIATPAGFFPDLEDALENRFQLKEAVVVDSDGDEERVVRDLGAAAAFYLENTLKPEMIIGISSWSAALLAMVNALHPSQRWKNTRVIQILGGVGNPNAEVHATQVTRRLADLIGGEATLLPAPGIVGSKSARDVLLKDRFVRAALALFPDITLALVGIGATEPSRGLASSGNVFSSQERKILAGQGAVGDICLRFFDASGREVKTELHDRVISIELPQLHTVKRVVGVAGGRRKAQAILGALRGKFVNVLITDLASAQRLLAQAPVAAGRATKKQVKR